MSGSFFLDTNILVYAYSNTDPVRSPIAQQLNRPQEGWISTQVLTELANVLARKFKASWPNICLIVENIDGNFPVHCNTAVTIAHATRLADRYGFSWFDALIVAAALECGCETLYSEDLRHGQLIEGSLRVVNPFLP